MLKTRNKNAFTLIEVLIAVVLVAVAVASLVGANVSYTKANGAGVDLSTSEFLVEQIRELTLVTDFDNLQLLDGQVYSPPHAADGSSLSEFAVFSQAITVENVNPGNFEQVVADGSSDFVRVTVTVALNSRQISEASWLRTSH